MTRTSVCAPRSAKFVVTRLRPHADEWEQAGWFPNEVFGWMAQAGYLGLKFPSEYGGRDDTVAAAVLVEEMARCGSGGVAAGLGAHTGIAMPPIATFGTEEQKRRYLVPGLRGEKIAALAITEPGAGSDVASIRTHATKVQDGYVVNGSKTFITGGVRADLLVTAVRTKPEGGQPDDSCAAQSGEAGSRARGRHEGISFLLIERGDGVSSSALRKLGWHASDTAEITFDDVFVPDENLLGAEHGGFYLIMANFQWERLLMALGAVGAMQGLLRPDACVRRRARARAEPGGAPPAGGDSGDARDLPGRHVRGPAAVRRRRGRGARGDDRQARDPASGI